MFIAQFNKCMVCCKNVHTYCLIKNSCSSRSTLPWTLDTGSFNGTAEEDTLYFNVWTRRDWDFSVLLLCLHIADIFFTKLSSVYADLFWLEDSENSSCAAAGEPSLWQILFAKRWMEGRISCLRLSCETSCNFAIKTNPLNVLSAATEPFGGVLLTRK